MAKPNHSDARSTEAQGFRRWYHTARWRRVRLHQLTIHPLCAMCAKAGRATPATVCDHVHPHHGNPIAFWNGPFQSLCDADPWRCHSSLKQQQELHGYSTSLGDDGYPTDAAHPFNRAR